MGAELIRLGEQFERLKDTVEGAMPDARAAILFDWENWWAIEGSAIRKAVLYDREESFPSAVGWNINRSYRTNVASLSITIPFANLIV